MRNRSWTWLVIVAIVAASAAAVRAGETKLPPLVYVCPMPADASVVEDQPGKCPVCGMTLAPTRLDSKWWCPTHQTVVVRDGPGKCPLDGKALVQVTLSEHWICAADPDKPLQEPGRCADGQPRKIVYQARAHGDHNPRHDGQFFMASDAWHHLEGTYPKSGLFRAYFYDNFTKPIPPAGFAGTLIVLDKNDKELGSFSMTPGSGGTLEAAIPAPLAALPLKAAAKIQFGSTIPQQRFDFYFSTYSKDATPPALSTRAQPTAPSAAKVATAGAPNRAPISKPRTPGADRTATAGRTSAAPAAAAAPASAPASTPAATAPATAAPSAASSPAVPLVLDSPLNIPPALADALDESKLPTDSAGLLAELSSRAKRVESLINEGDLAQVWLPATGTKTVALVLDSRSKTLTPAAKSRVDSDVKRIVVASWALDSYGDLGSREKIAEAYADLAAAITDLKAAYATP